MSLPLLLALSWFISPPSANATQVASFSRRPRLVVAIVIDQFRADFLTRFTERFLPEHSGRKLGGFRLLMEHGAYFPFAEYDLLQAMTGPGHATILTGARPYLAGVPSNDWMDAASGKPMYCAADADHHWIGTSTRKDRAGTSPKNLVVTTIGDELKNAGFASKVVSIALKDRSAIFLGGKRANLALWFDGKVNRWISSDYYEPTGKLPAWVDQLNSGIATRLEVPAKWDLPAREKSTGRSLSTEDNPVLAEDPAVTKFGLTFPHEGRLSSGAALAGPIGVELTVDAALASIDSMELGKDDTPDVLAFSLSSHDYIGHAFGPNSRESEEITIAEDRQLSRFFNTLAEKVPGGLDEVTIVLTADHGAPPNPDWLRSQRVAAGRFDETGITARLEKKFTALAGKPRVGGTEWITYHEDLDWYFNREAIAKSGKPMSAFEEIARKELQSEEGSLFVLTATDVRGGKLPAGAMGARVKNTWFEGRHPDAFVIPRPYFMAEGDTVSHLTGWSYDRTVPIIFFGKGIKRGTNADPAEVIDIAPTLSWILGIVPPTGSEGKRLISALR